MDYDNILQHLNNLNTDNLTPSSKVAFLLLVEAAVLVSGDRQHEYGDFKDNIDLVVSEVGSITSDQAIDTMIAFKHARLHYNPNHHDSKVDSVAYSALKHALSESTELYGEPTSSYTNQDQ